MTSIHKKVGTKTNVPSFPPDLSKVPEEFQQTGISIYQNIPSDQNGKKKYTPLRLKKHCYGNNERRSFDTQTNVNKQDVGNQHYVANNSNLKSPNQASPYTSPVPSISLTPPIKQSSPPNSSAAPFPEIVVSQQPPVPLAEPCNPMPFDSGLNMCPTYHAPVPQPAPLPLAPVPVYDFVHTNSALSMSEDGRDLPLHNLRSVRFFYNLGIEFFRRGNFYSTPEPYRNPISQQPDPAPHDRVWCSYDGSMWMCESSVPDYATCRCGQCTRPYNA